MLQIIMTVNVIDANIKFNSLIYKISIKTYLSDVVSRIKDIYVARAMYSVHRLPEPTGLFSR